jgi:hypothetical protein
MHARHGAVAEGAAVLAGPQLRVDPAPSKKRATMSASVGEKLR